MMSEQTAYDNLPPQRRLFVDEYLKDFNQTRAAIRAKYSEKTATQQASRLLTYVNIQEAIKERMRAAAMGADEVLYHLAQIARGDLADLLDDKGQPSIKAAKLLGKSNLIKKLKTKTIITTTDETGEGTDVFEDTIEIYDRMRALELIGKAHGLFTDKMDLTSGGEKIIPILKTGMNTDEL